MKQSIQIGIGLVLIILLLAFINLQPKEKSINWTPTFSHLDKNPFGTYVLYNELKEWIPGNEILALNDTQFYNDLNPNTDSIFALHINRPANIIIINPDLDIYSFETEKLIDLVIGGHTIFISSRSFPSEFFNTLNADLDATFNLIKDSVHIQTNTNTSLIYPKGSIMYTFADAYQQYDKYSYVQNAYESSDPNSIKLNFGQGSLILHSFPYAFTNYYVLNDNPEYKEYVQDVINMFPKQRTFWIPANSRTSKEVRNNQGYLSIIRQIPPLFSAWKLLIIGLLIYVLFKAKRIQRSIPIIPTLKNESKAYIQVISNLYFQEKDYLTLVHKKMVFFYDNLRSDFHIDNYYFLNSEVIAHKTQSSNSDVKELLKLINKCKQQEAFTQEEFDTFCLLTDKILKS